MARGIVIGVNTIPLEVCIECADPLSARRSAMNARRGGASRIELCRDVASGGLTPGPVAMHAAIDAFGRGNGAMVMIRPRAGDFTYTADEIAEMERQIIEAARAGASGVVFGLLVGHDIARDETERLTRIAVDRGLTVTFHRAFDAVADSLGAIDTLVAIGVARILTSGTPWGDGGTAAEGVDALVGYIERAAGRIEIVIGGGVTRANAKKILANVTTAGPGSSGTGSSGTGSTSFHAYSDLIANDITDAGRVETMVRLLTNGQATSTER